MIVLAAKKFDIGDRVASLYEKKLWVDFSRLEIHAQSVTHQTVAGNNSTRAPVVLLSGQRFDIVADFGGIHV